MMGGIKKRKRMSNITTFLSDIPHETLDAKK
jgi:hypothetical protein